MFILSTPNSVRRGPTVFQHPISPAGKQIVMLGHMRKIIPFNNVSFLSSNQLEQGIAFWGWNKYDAGELSIIMVLVISRPSFDKSLT